MPINNIRENLSKENIYPVNNIDRFYVKKEEKFFIHFHKGQYWKVKKNINII